MDVRLTVASQVAISHIIAEDEEDVGLLYVLLGAHQGRQANHAYPGEPYCLVGLHKILFFNSTHLYFEPSTFRFYSSTFRFLR